MCRASDLRALLLFDTPYSVWCAVHRATVLFRPRELTKGFGHIEIDICCISAVSFVRFESVSYFLWRWRGTKMFASAAPTWHAG